MWSYRRCDEHRIVEKLYNVAHELCFGETKVVDQSCRL